jgi:hypothetical protein
MELKTLVICGDSYFTPDVRYPGTHFSEHLTKHFNVINLARAGMSNIGICFQMNQAINFNPAYMVVMRTSPGRLEIPVGKLGPNVSLKDIRYCDQVSATVGNPHVGDENSPLISDVIETLIHDNCWTSGDKGKYNLTAEQKNAVKQYLLHLYDDELKFMIDDWSFSYWVYVAREKGIKVLDLDRMQTENPFTKPWEQGQFKMVYHTTPKQQIGLYNLVLSKLIELEKVDKQH